jgi:hypothetical protein
VRAFARDNAGGPLEVAGGNVKSQNVRSWNDRSLGQSWFYRVSLGLTLVLVLFAQGCATGAKSSRSGGQTSGQGSSAQASSGQVFSPDGYKPELKPYQKAFVPRSASEYVVGGVRLNNTEYDIPIVINDAVEMWVDYFTGRGRKHFEKYLER